MHRNTNGKQTDFTVYTCAFHNILYRIQNNTYMSDTKVGKNKCFTLQPESAIPQIVLELNLSQLLFSTSVSMSET